MGRRTRGAGNTAVKPPYPTTGSAPGYHQSGTTWTSAMANMVQEEQNHVIEDVGGLTLDETDDTQMAKVLSHVRGIRSNATDITGLTSLDRRVAVAANSCDVGGDTSLVAAATNGDCATGAGLDRAVLASGNVTIEGSVATSLIAASFDAKVSNPAVVSAVVASRGDTLDGINCATAGSQSVILASSGTAADRTLIDPAATEALVAASTGSEVGPDGAQAAVVASKNCDVNRGTRSVIVASNDSLINDATASSCAIIGSQAAIGGPGAYNVALASQDVAMTSGGGANAVIACAQAGGANPAIPNPGAVSILGSSTGDVDITGTGCTMLSCDTGAGTGPLLSGTRCSALSSDGQFDVAGTNTVVLASSWGGTGIVLGAGDNNKVVLGDALGGGVGASLRTNVTDAVTGGVLADAAYVGTGADYAECFKNNKPGVLPAGSIVSHIQGEAVPAQPGDRVLGVVSTDPTVVGNAAPLHWQGATKRTEFGAVERDEESHALGAKGYDPARAYTNRVERSEEWTVVALLGQVPVRVDDTVQPGSYVVPALHGIGTHADEPPRTGRPLECLRVLRKSTKKRGCAIALCLVG